VLGAVLRPRVVGEASLAQDALEAVDCQDKLDLLLQVGGRGNCLLQAVEKAV